MRRNIALLSVLSAFVLTTGCDLETGRSGNQATNNVEQVDPLPYPETCEIIDGITVCDDHVWGEDGYVCRHFADDFAEECDEADVPCWILTFGNCYRNYHYWLGYDLPEGHAVNIIEVEYPGPNAKYCIVEPQTNEIVSCWIEEDTGAPGELPDFVMEDLYDEYPWFEEQTDEGWPQYQEVYEHEDYDPGPTTEEQSPVYTPGCTDSTADNYDPNADQDDGSCTYSPSGY